MIGCSWIDISCVVESDGKLLVTEVGNSVPFEIKRVFWVKDVAYGCSRGNHATKKTKIILIPISGSCNVVVDNGITEEIIPMIDPTKGLCIDPMIWRSMKDFTPDCVMMAICDHTFNPGDETYDDYQEYLKALGD